jgi:hypothetical protein
MINYIGITCPPLQDLCRLHIQVLYLIKNMKLKKQIFLLTLVGIIACQDTSPDYQQEDIEKAVKSWILKYAKYPQSYKPQSWSQFDFGVTVLKGKKVIGEDSYSIHHRHSLRNKDSVLIEFEAYFIVENDLDVNVIEKERSLSIGGAHPPKTSIWTDLFSRELTQTDSLYFEQKKKDKLRQLTDKLREAKENGFIEDSTFNELNQYFDQ